MYEDCIYKGICEDECENLCIQYKEMSYLLKTSNLPKKHWKQHRLTPEDCDLQSFEKLAEIQQNIKQFVDEGNNLYLYSQQVGNGKTTWMIKLLLQYFHEVWEGNGLTERGLFINVPTYLSQCKQAISSPNEELFKIQKRLLDVDLVIFDDVIVTNLSNYDYSTLMSFIDSRLFSGKSTFFTGNYTPKQLTEFVNPRLVSRICEGTLIELRGNDRRVTV